MPADPPLDRPLGQRRLALASKHGSFSRRKAAVIRHVPEVIMLLLMLTFILSSVLGVASGAEGHRPSATAYAMVILIVLLVLAIIDLDRPRRGFVEVSHQSLIELQERIESNENLIPIRHDPTACRWWISPPIDFDRSRDDGWDVARQIEIGFFCKNLLAQAP